MGKICAQCCSECNLASEQHWLLSWGQLQDTQGDCPMKLSRRKEEQHHQQCRPVTWREQFRQVAGEGFRQGRCDLCKHQSAVTVPPSRDKSSTKGEDSVSPTPVARPCSLDLVCRCFTAVTGAHLVACSPVMHEALDFSPRTKYTGAGGGAPTPVILALRRGRQKDQKLRV